MKVTVAMTTFNSEGTLVRALESVDRQTGAGSGFELELIVVDDCSTDNTVGILKSRGIRYLSTGKNSRGPNRGRNMALQAATGDFICFLDHDDTWHPQKVRRQLDAIGGHPICTTSYEVVDLKAERRYIKGGTSAIVRTYPPNHAFRNILSKNTHGQPAYLSTVMISKYLRNILFEEHFGQVDYDWLLRLFEHKSSVHIEEPLATRFIGGKNLSLHSQYRSCDYHYSLMTLERYERKYPRLVRSAVKRVNGTRARYHYDNGDMSRARRYFKRAQLDLKSILYYVTSFVGYSWVRARFRVFG